ncbi:MAG: AAA family ATPase [Chloroflexota bacterium]
MTQQKSQQPPLGEPLSQIFEDVAEADWAFDFLLETVKQLGINGPYDPRVALTLAQRAGKLCLHLNFGRWLVLGFRAAGTTPHRVEMALLTDKVAWDEQFASFPATPKEGEPEVQSYLLPLTQVNPLTSDLQRAFNATLDIIATKFGGWKKSAYWKHHNPEIIEAMFDPEKRAQLFAGSLSDTELRYERHRTAFYQDVSEEASTYEAEPIEPISREDTIAIDEAETVVNDEQQETIHPKSSEGETGAGIATSDIDPKSEPTASETPSEKPVINPAYPLSQLVAETGFDEAQLTRWVKAIERKGQAIVYGPPGTGKTFIAEKLAQHLIGGSDGFADLVQFHPAYAYEDFIQGIRPQSEGETLTYPLVPGRFLNVCRQATQRQGICVLIIDEINRANLARVFGELMYLLEYRNRDIPLASGGRLRIPDNVRLIGTMNTADRSIAMVDHALRRRFAFLRLSPNYEILRHYHRDQKSDINIEGLIKQLKALNKQINDTHYELGITFFLRKNLSEELPNIWQLEIEPYLEEYFFDQPETIEDFRWETIKNRL